MATTPNEKMVADVKALLAAIAPVNRAALILNPAQAIALRSLYDADALTVFDLGQPSGGHADCARFGQFRQRVIAADV